VAEKAGQARSAGESLRWRLEARGEPTKLAEESRTGMSGARVCAAHGREGRGVGAPKAVPVDA